MQFMKLFDLTISNSAVATSLQYIIIDLSTWLEHPQSVLIMQDNTPIFTPTCRQTVFQCSNY